MKKTTFFFFILLRNISILLADELSFDIDKTITYEHHQELYVHATSANINIFKRANRTVTFDIKLLNSNNGNFPFELEVVIKNLKFNILRSSVNHSLVSYDSENHEFAGLHNKIASLYDNIINKPLRFRIDKKCVANETTRTLNELKQNISEILITRGINGVFGAQELDEFADIISSFFYLANTDIELERYDVYKLRNKGAESGKLYFDIAALDFDKIHYNIQGYRNTRLDHNNSCRLNIDGIAYINKSNAMIQCSNTHFKGATQLLVQGETQNTPCFFTIKGTRKLIPVSE